MKRAPRRNPHRLRRLALSAVAAGAVCLAAMFFQTYTGRHAPLTYTARLDSLLTAVESDAAQKPTEQRPVAPPKKRFSTIVSHRHAYEHRRHKNDERSKRTPTRTRKAPTTASTAKSDSATFQHTTPIDLNEADSLTLIRLKGIGPTFAHRVLSYRRRLGGFVSTTQLLEVRDFPAELVSAFCVQEPAVRRMNLNRADAAELARHPYLNRRQVQTIARWRRMHGRLSSLQQLSNSEAFTDNDFQRLAPYVTFHDAEP